MCACVRVCVCVRVRACVHVRAHVYVYVCAHVCVCGDRVVQLLHGDPWFLGYGLANCTTADRWSGAPF